MQEEGQAAALGSIVGEGNGDVLDLLQTCSDDVVAMYVDWILKGVTLLSPLHEQVLLPTTPFDSYSYYSYTLTPTPTPTTPTLLLRLLLLLLLHSYSNSYDSDYYPYYSDSY